ncbi:response regulator transcription factor [Mucilaginibacter sp. BJC16-A38]|uniref:response regulator transcription factor n=1 Tax=Mucilaginibacter phenanthrenivorans TaxID=1234842 RepID=UPI0021579D96|nr:response regulator transcription factor [Mucilaginibacter phenanthrenivorans]MCR8558123.1 response regulator transcription factor [Mucilaginibacter phenanthrenivorans]
METIRVAVIDDQNIFRQSLAALIRNEEGFELATESVNGDDFLAKLNAATQLPHLALVDMNMPGLNGIELNAILHQKYPTIRVIILSVHGQERLIAKMIHEGVCSYLLKNCDRDELILAIKTVYKSGFYLNANALEAIQKVSAYKTKVVSGISSIPVELTMRETEILRLICQEYSNVEISQRLFLSARTVEGHRNNLLSKIGCRNTAGLVLFAVKHRIYEMIF